MDQSVPVRETWNAKIFSTYRLLVGLPCTYVQAVPGKMQTNQNETLGWYVLYFQYFTRSLCTQKAGLRLLSHQRHLVKQFQTQTVYIV
jgi:hypothetical protein